MGDSAGIGPELVSKLLSEDITKRANIVVISEKNVFENGNRIAGYSNNLEVVENITKENIMKPIKLIDKVMKLNGFKNLRIAIQAINPHVEFGTEEIISAIKEAKKIGYNFDGPLPCDTFFIIAYKKKNYDRMVGMYHDALQSNFKAFGFDRGVTVKGGLPAPITTIAHSTAFDIAGKNQANLNPILNSFKIPLTMVENRI